MKPTTLSIKESPLSFMGKVSNQAHFEQTIYTKAKALSSCYRGGAWQFLNFGNNVVFMSPEASATFSVSLKSGEVLELSSISFGLLVTFSAMQALLVSPKYAFLKSRVQNLKDRALSYKEEGQVIFCSSYLS